MNVITYRGPGMSGGLSTAVGQAWNEYASLGDSWWHVDKNNLQFLVHGLEKAIEVTGISTELIEGHYRYCNEFLWPIMHDMEEFAIYHPKDRQLYKQFNSFISQSISQSLTKTSTDQATYLVHDYHFALLPQLLRREANARSVSFWHIPWPKTISQWSAVSQLADIARGLLSSEAIGFHTEEYVANFIKFVDENLPEYKCDWQKMTISLIQRRHTNISIERVTDLMVVPIGIDYQSWQSLADEDNSTELQHPLLMQNRLYILSVDRADYTKGVYNRLAAIYSFFEQFPEWREKVTFVQACGRTRPGLPAFDNYWYECHQRRKEIENMWGTQDWNPLVWLNSSQSSNSLAQLYKNAAVMLVNPIRDGLNLTAKEYVACQGSKAGVLALSEGAGAWCELGNYCINIDPSQPERMAASLNKALLLSAGEKSLRMGLLGEIVKKNNLANWWYRLRNRLENKLEKHVVGEQHAQLLPPIAASRR